MKSVLIAHTIVAEAFKPSRISFMLVVIVQSEHFVSPISLDMIAAVYQLTLPYYRSVTTDQTRYA